MSFLSARSDGLGYYYGWLPGDHRQINVRFEAAGWRAYVGNHKLDAFYDSKDDAERAAVSWAALNPDEGE